MKRVLDINTATGRWRYATTNVVEESDVATASAAAKIPKADANGKIAAEFVPLLVSSVHVEEADGAPSHTQVMKLIVGNGDLSYVGAGIVRIKTAADALPPGGIPTLTVRTADSATIVTNVTTVVVTNATLTNLTGGAVQIATGGGVGGGGGNTDGPGGKLYLWENFI